MSMITEDVLEEIQELSKKRFLPIIGPVKGEYLVNTVKKYNVTTVLEVGTLVGYSAILMARNLPDTGKITTIEINPESAKTAKDNINRAGLADMVDIHTGNALTVIPGIDGNFDMVFIDAAKNEYLDYLMLADNKINRNGIVFADNVKIFASDMSNYLDYVRNSGNYQSEYIDVGFDGMEVSISLL